ncbi:hypothetical protein XM38_025840 [Halomicronema hongdechloris C2206]|uniref:Uncharacterized protein n=1 Tax=Halomicronema hongdechloris C2206 TaxID=1641165 RepID=A0A1Z3HMW5_9CYAN|nr:hypothetical protein [Halomicronema hongdechloris]ASC71631.1 hypothetical protein XM38_025840 [Halomicronema hongdechloris C2206]
MVRLKVIDNYDSRFSLELEAQQTLFGLLCAPSFLQQVCQQAQAECVEFTAKLFQPLPYTRNTPKGMPAEFEPYHNSPDYIIINVPPPFMFKAKIFQPSRLCAVYRKLGHSVSEASEARG